MLIVTVIIVGNFNPHFREGSDLKAENMPKDTIISIHTSAKEVTEQVLKEVAEIEFQSTLPRRK